MSTSSDPHHAGTSTLIFPEDLATLYDEDYYERGVETGKSCYSNYRWLPELTIPMAMVLIDTLGIRPGQRVLDFGCAKGFVTRALRMLHRNAHGIDISAYAISQATEDIRPHVTLVDDLDAFASKRRFDHAIAKDVLEHVPYEAIEDTVRNLAQMSDSLLVVVPVGQSTPRGNRYVIEAYERDVTHVIREEPRWWLQLLERYYGDVNWRYHIEGLKDNWMKVDPHGNAAFICRRPWCR